MIILLKRKKLTNQQKKRSRNDKITEVIQISDVEDNEINSEEEELNERSDHITELDHELVTNLEFRLPRFEILEDAVRSFHTQFRKVQCTLRVTINHKPRWKKSSINSIEIFGSIIYVDCNSCTDDRRMTRLPTGIDDSHGW
ncbi:hypothetical protein GLOIN_2v1487494 [Rhizophagus irregularis DAOM 181602=DAOM 197198]|nr:hypothetical protein GLOIN_2v1487494 [Rhizophagus irregularis DAOM 181602=DAOM 197198]